MPSAPPWPVGVSPRSGIYPTGALLDGFMGRRFLKSNSGGASPPHPSRRSGGRTGERLLMLMAMQKKSICAKCNAGIK